MNRLLQINIPTRNRAHLLDELLNSFGPRPAWVQVAVFDNASEDDTAAVAQKHSVDHYERTTTNRGPAHNQLRAASFSSGARYTWVLGDDELLAPGGWAEIWTSLQSDPAWVLLGSTGLASGYSDVSLWARHALRVNTEALLHPTCWSGNIFRDDAFDHEIARQYAERGSIFPHFHALLRGLSQSGGSVAVPRKPTVLYRKVRPLPPDNEHPKDTDHHLAECADTFNTLFGLGLRRDVFSPVVSRRLLKEPFRHWRYAADPRNWKKVVNRLRHLLP